MIYNEKIFILFLLTITFLFAGFSASAQPVDLRIVVDISADVRKSAPDRQHLDAIHLLVNQLPVGSRAGIWTFGRYVNHLVTYGKVTPDWLNTAGDGISKIRSVASKRDIYSALKNAAFDIDKSSVLPRHILLLSSGDLDLSDSAANNKLRGLLLNTLLPKMMNAGIRIHTLSLSDNNGTGLLRTLSRETGGYSLVSRSPEKIIYFCNKLAENFRPDNYIPIHENRFAVDTHVTEFNATLFGGSPSSLIVTSPGGKIYSTETANTHTLLGKHFARYKISNPEMGQWKISGNLSPHSRVYVRGNHVLDIDGLTPAYVTSENIIVSASTINPGQETGIQGSSEDTEFAITITDIENRSGSDLNGKNGFTQSMTAASTGEGIYQAEIQGLSQEGLYMLSTVAKTLDYERGLDRLIQVNELFKMDVSTEKTNEKLAYNIQILPSDTDLVLNKTSIIATITDSDGKWNVRTVEFTGDKSWQLMLDDDNQSTEFKVELDFRGRTFSGREVHYRLKPLIIELTQRVKAKGQTLAPGDPTLNDANGQVVGPGTLPGIVTEQGINNRAPEQLQAAGNQTVKRGSYVWILIIGTGFVLGAALVLFYFWQTSRKPSDNKGKTGAPIEKEVSATKAPDAKVPDEPPVIREVVGREAIDPDKNKKPAVTSDQPDEISSLELAADRSESAEKGRPRDQGDDDLDVEIDFDADLIEETKLASEWRDLDAQSNLSAREENDLDIDFDIDETDQQKTDKNA